MVRQMALRPLALLHRLSRGFPGKVALPRLSFVDFVISVIHLIFSWYGFLGLDGASC